MSNKLENKLKVLESKKETLFVRVQNLYDVSKTVSTDAAQLEIFKRRYGTLEGTLNELNSVVLEINEIKLALDDKAVLSFAVLDAVDEICSHIEEVAKSLSNPKSSKGVRDASQSRSETEAKSNKLLRLPKIELIGFDGNVRNWPVFFEMFNSLVHQNQDLSNSEKIHYLIGKLSGKALNVCAGIPPVADNYLIVWNSLVERYQDRRFLANSYLEQIFNFKRLNSDSSGALNAFLEHFDASVSALKQLSLNDLSDFMLVYLTLDKLHPETVKDFEMQHRNRNAIPTYSELVQFIKDQAKMMTFSKSVKPVNSSTQNRSQTFYSSSQSKTNCLSCQQGSHLLSNCRKFLNWNPFERYQFVKGNSLCLSCLSVNHKVSNCKNRVDCSKCKGRHHELLHFVKNSSLSENRTEGSQANKPQSSSSGNRETVHSLWSTGNSLKSTTVLLSTIVVHVVDKGGSLHKLRFLLDGGSQSNFLLTRCVQKLGLDMVRSSVSVTGLGNSSQAIQGVVQLVFASRIEPSPKYSTELLVIDHITDKLPTYPIDVSGLDYLKSPNLADDTFDRPGDIDGIFGANVFAKIIGTKKIVGPENFPVAIETSLGFVVMGKVPVVDESSSVKSFCSIEKLEQTVSKFFEIEDIPSTSVPKFISEEDNYCERFFSQTCIKNSSGRYSVSLPFRDDPSTLGDSYQQAHDRFLSLERKLEGKSELRIAYDSAMRDYFEKNHIVPVSDISLEDVSYYIPHHGVLKTSSSTPLRVVFDASMKTSSSVSLNDILYAGPKLQSDVFDLLLKFRLFPVAMSADIRQMYRQILINPDNRRFQRLLWRFDPMSPLTVFEINTVAFGIKSSPYLALRTVHQLADDQSGNFPEAAQVIKKGFYMDDLICSFENNEDAVRLCKDLIRVFAAGGFELVKWASNVPEVLQDIPSSDRLTERVEFDRDSFKILGLEWCPKMDNFGFRLNCFERNCTKRSMLSLVARFFDPLGIIAPVIMMAKLMVKECWKLKLNWDSKTPAYLENLWKKFCSELNLLFDFKIPRHVGVFSNSQVSLIGFADSSEKGLGAVVYVRSFHNSAFTVRLLCSKSKVSPLKAVTIPRLELCAAVLLAKLLNFVCTTFSDKISINSIVALTDSMVVLNWINSSSGRFKTFVANRVGVIQDLVPADHWYHVPGKFNMADCVSRGLTPSQFVNKGDWVVGPSWLLLNEGEWPIERWIHTPGLPEEKAVSLNVVEEKDSYLHIVISKFSSWPKLTRVMVYVFRFLKLLPNAREKRTCAEIDYVENFLFRFVQSTHFGNELKNLESNKGCSKYLLKLRPFLNKGIIRVGGRLANANVDYEVKHPILLPKKDHIVNLIVDYYHRSNFHCGASLLLGLLRQKFWILAARDLVRKRIHLCNLCFRCNPKSIFPLMADLPFPRVNQAKAFLHTGVDFAGPFRISMSRYRGVRSQKAYLCLFVCLCTKAVHLECASDLSTSTFLSAFKRFLSRRGPCSVMYSDCGTNFIGAKNALNEIYRLLESSDFKDAVKEELLKHRIEWKFNPPRAPHFGGIWESNIKSCKTLLLKVIGDQLLTFEEFTTVLTQVEVLLNSRPLYCLSSDPSDPEALTPAHFLTLTPLKHLPAADLSNNPNLLVRKTLLDKMVQSFWAKWHLEYLTSLQPRSKWETGSEVLQVGTVVVIISDGVPPLQWPLGVVEELYPGRDGISRVARIKTKAGSCKRPLVKLCPLPSQ